MKLVIVENEIDIKNQEKKNWKNMKVSNKNREFDLQESSGVAKREKGLLASCSCRTRE